MSWRRSTLSARRVTVAVGLVLASGVTVPAVLARTSPPSQVAAPEPAPSPDPSPAPAGTPVPRDAVTPTELDSPATAPPATPSEPAQGPKKRARRTVLDDRELAAARQAAADFAAAYASYRFDETPEDAAARIGAWTTAELAAQLEANAGGAAGRAALAEREQVAEAQVETVTVQRVDGTAIDALVVVEQKVTSVDGGETRWPSYLVQVTRVGDGWRVAALQP